VESIDGRHQRSVRSREAVVEAMLDLLRESGTQPSAQAVAERAAVSLRTVFRLFEDVDSMFAAAVTSQVQRVGARFEPLAATGTLTARIDALVRHRADLFEEIAPVRRMALRRDHHDAVREWLDRSHELLRRQTANQFAPELAASSSRRSTRPPAGRRGTRCGASRTSITTPRSRSSPTPSAGCSTVRSSAQCGKSFAGPRPATSGR
jgi:AcrR family transcriptional regulator